MAYKKTIIIIIASVQLLCGTAPAWGCVKDSSMLRHVQAVLDVLNAADATAWLCVVLVSACMTSRWDRQQKGDHVMYTRPHCFGSMLGCLLSAGSLPPLGMRQLWQLSYRTYRLVCYLQLGQLPWRFIA